MASTSWQPKPTRTVSSASSFPLTLNNGDVLLINGSINFSASAGQSPITLASGASAKIIINGSVTLRGADASGITGATAAINVPEGAVLTIYSAHDEELSTSRSAPKDTLTVTGGNAAAGTEGGDALKDVAIEHGPTYHYRWYFGGGNGGGAAAAIGGNGGAGGAAGRAGSSGSAGTQTGTDGHGWNDAKLGNGGRQGSSSTLTPLVIYDLMDCQINLNQSVYTYTGSAFKPRITSVSYSAASDRDGRSISGSNKTLSGGYSAYSYGENIHCPTGTVTVLGSQNSKRTTVTNDGSVIGIVEKEFTIKKATLTAPITLSTTTPYVGQSMTATLSGYYLLHRGQRQLKHPAAGKQRQGGGTEGNMVADRRRGKPYLHHAGHHQPCRRAGKPLFCQSLPFQSGYRPANRGAGCGAGTVRHHLSRQAGHDPRSFGGRGGSAFRRRLQRRIRGAVLPAGYPRKNHRQYPDPREYHGTVMFRSRCAQRFEI